jgi:hypothetical protein
VQDRNEQAQDVYAHFGLAMYWAQVFEHGVVNLIAVYRRLHGLLITDREIDDTYEREFEKTLGGILHDLKSEIALPKDIEAKSQQALQIRNRLSHRYFREHAVRKRTSIDDQGASQNEGSICRH